jgi:hypothetical protein
MGGIAPATFPADSQQGNPVTTCGETDYFRRENRSGASSVLE